MLITAPYCRSMFKLSCIIIFTFILILSTIKLPGLDIKTPKEIKSDFNSYQANLPKNPTECKTYIEDTKSYLRKDNTTYECKALEEEDCQTTYDEYYEKADPLSVFLRSSTCDLDWPQFGSVSKEELNFPLAYLITAFTDARNLELMLATIFRPHNSYCIHIDPKSDPIFSRTVQQLLSCYRVRYPGSYIFSSSRNVSVFYMHFSIVEAELICLRDLLDNDKPWSYAVDMAGSEVMLFTNRELVANLSSTDKPEIYTESFPMPENNMFRIQHKYKLQEGAAFDPDHAKANLVQMKEAPDPIPFNLTIYKGAKSYRLPRQFVDFLLNHQVATAFIEWSKTTSVPDEMVVPTLARIASVKMSGDSWLVDQSYVPKPRYHFQLWYSGCRGRWRNAVCVFSLKDLSTIVRSGCYLVNKVRSDFEPYLAECFRDVIMKREMLE